MLRLQKTFQGAHPSQTYQAAESAPQLKRTGSQCWDQAAQDWHFFSAT